MFQQDYRIAKIQVHIELLLALLDWTAFSKTDVEEQPDSEFFLERLCMYVRIPQENYTVLKDLLYISRNCEGGFDLYEV